MNHEVHTLDVDASRGDVGGDEDGRLTAAAAALLEPVEVLQAGALLHVAVEALDGKPERLEDGEEPAQRGDGVDEDDDQAGFLREDVVQERVALVLCR